MTDYSKPFKLRVTHELNGHVYNSHVVPFSSAESRQQRLDRLRLARPEFYDVTKIETWEVFEPEITLHDPELYRPREESAA